MTVSTVYFTLSGASSIKVCPTICQQSRIFGHGNLRPLNLPFIIDASSMVQQVKGWRRYGRWRSWMSVKEVYPTFCVPSILFSQIYLST